MLGESLNNKFRVALYDALGPALDDALHDALRPVLYQALDRTNEAIFN